MKVTQLFTVIHTNDNEESFATQDMILKCICDHGLCDTSDVKNLIENHKNVVEKVARLLSLDEETIHQELLHVYNYKDVFDLYEAQIVQLMSDTHLEDSGETTNDESEDEEEDDDIEEEYEYTLQEKLSMCVLDKVTKMDNVVNMNLVVSTIAMILSGMSMLVIMKGLF